MILFKPKVLGKCVECDIDVTKEQEHTKFLSVSAVYDPDHIGWEYYYIHNHCIHEMHFHKNWYKEMVNRMIHESAESDWCAFCGMKK